MEKPILDFLTNLNPVVQGVSGTILGILIFIILIKVFAPTLSRKNLKKSIGYVGYVSSFISKGGLGKIVVTVSGGSFIVPATCKGESLSVQTKVMVESLEGKTFVVKRIKYSQDSKNSKQTKK